MQARATGSMLFEYNNAVRSWIADNPGASNANHLGSTWLKPTSCGGTTTKLYLRCNFPDATSASPIAFGSISLSSSIVRSTGGGVTRLTVTTTTSPFKLGDKIRSDLAGLATVVAAAGSTSSSTPVLMASDGQYKSTPTTGAITMVASNAAANDIWLRTDGSNTMKNNLAFDTSKSASMRQLLNVSRIQAAAAEIFYIGAPNGALSSQMVVVDADQRIAGNLMIQNAANKAAALDISRGNVEIRAGNLNVTGNTRSTGSINAGTSIEAGTSIKAGSTIEAGTDIKANRNMYAKQFVDLDNSTFFLDPSETSVLRNAQIKGTASVDQRATFGEYIEVKGVATPGLFCAPNGLLARDSAGKSLSCESGKWAYSGGTLDIVTVSTSFRSSSTTLTCPSGYKRLSCYFTSSDDKNADFYYGTSPIGSNACAIYSSNHRYANTNGYMDCYK